MNSYKKFFAVVLLFTVVAAHTFATPVDFPASPYPWTFYASNIIEAWNLSPKEYKQGRGIRILNIDSGIDLSSADIANKVIEARSFRKKIDSSLPYPFYDFAGHGTPVAGVMVGSPNKRGSSGVAPEAQLYVAAISYQDTSEVVRAIRWGIELRVDIINLEFITSEQDPNLPEIIMAIEEAYKEGIIVVNPAGNSGASQLDPIAKHKNVISVGSVGSDLRHISFSQYGPELDLVAPQPGALLPYNSGLARDSQYVFKFEETGEKIKTSGMAAVRSVFTGKKSIRGKLVYVDLNDKDTWKRLGPHSIALLDGAPRLRPEKLVSLFLEYNVLAIAVAHHSTDFTTPFTMLSDELLKIPVVYLRKKNGSRIIKKLSEGANIILDIKITPGNYVSFNGTSGAAPFVVGVIALVKAVNPNLSPVEILRVLKETAFIPEGRDNGKNQYGAGIVNAYRAVKEALDLGSKKKIFTTSQNEL